MRFFTGSQHHVLRRVVAAALSVVLLSPVGPRPAVASPATTTLRAGLEGREHEIAAGLEETPPSADLTPYDLPLEAQTPRFLSAKQALLSSQVERWLNDRVGRLQMEHLKATLALIVRAPAKAPNYAVAADRFKAVAERWHQAIQRVLDQRQNLEKQYQRSGSPLPAADAQAFSAAETYINDAFARAEAGLAYARAHAPQSASAPVASDFSGPAVVDMTSPTLSPALPAARPLTPVESETSSAPGLKDGGELAAELRSRGWTPEGAEATAFINEIQGVLRGLRQTPFPVFQGLVYEGLALTAGHAWVAQQLEAVAHAHDLHRGNVRKNISAQATPAMELIIHPNLPIAPPPPSMPWSDRLHQAKSLASGIVSQRVQPSDIAPATLETINQTIKTLAETLWHREFTAPLPTEVGLEEGDAVETILRGEPIEELTAEQAQAVVAQVEAFGKSGGEYGWGWVQQFPTRPLDTGVWVYEGDGWVLHPLSSVMAHRHQSPDQGLKETAKALISVVAGWLRPGGSHATMSSWTAYDTAWVKVAPVMPGTLPERIGRPDADGIRRYAIQLDLNDQGDAEGRLRDAQGRVRPPERLRILVTETYIDMLPPLPTPAGLEEPRTFGTVFDYGLLAKPDALWRTPAQWRQWLAGAGSETYLQGLYGDNAALVSDRRAAYLRVLAQYERDYGAAEPVAIFRASGRVHWLGVHIDRPGAEAPVNRFGINGRELIMVAGRQPEGNLTVQLRSTSENPFGQEPYRLDFDVRAQVFQPFPDAPIKLTDSTATEPNSWNQTAYRMGDAIRVDGKTPVEFVAGVAYLLHHGVPGGLTRGFRAAMEGNIPPAMGMSSSSALTIAISQAFTAVNQIELVERDPARDRRQMTFADWLIRTGYAEWIVRTRGGNADHRTILFSRPGGISHLGKTEVLAQMQLPASVAAVVLNTPPRKDDDDDTSARRVAAYQRGLQFLRRAFIGQETLGAIVESGATAAQIAAAIRDYIPEDDPEARATTLAQIADIARSLAMRRLLEDGSVTDEEKIARLFRMTKAYQEQQRTTDYDGDPAPWNLAVVAKTGITNAALDAWIARLQTDLPPDSPDRLENLAAIGAYGVSVATVDDMVRALQQTLGDDWVHVAPIMQGVGFGGTVLTFVDTAQPGLLDRVKQFYRTYAAEHFSGAFMEPILVTPGRGAEALVPPTAAGLEELGPFTKALSPNIVRALEALRATNPAAVERFVALQQAAADRWRRLVAALHAPLTVAIVVPAYAGDIPRIRQQEAFSWKLRELQALAALDPKGLVRFTMYVVDDKPQLGLANVVTEAVDRTWYDATRITVAYLRLTEELHRVPGLSRAEDSRKWGAVRAGMAVALQQRANIVAMSDSDTNQRLTELPNLLAPILDDRAAVAIGSRFLPGAATTAMGIHNYLEAFLYNPFVNLAMPELGRLPIRDVQSGVKAFSADALREPLLAMRGAGFAADAELLWLIARAGGRIVETPRSEVEESPGASTIEPTRHYALTREVQAALAEHDGPTLSADAEQVAARIPQTPAAVEAVARQQNRLAQAVDALQTGRPFDEAAASVHDIFAPAAGLEEGDRVERVLKGEVVLRLTDQQALSVVTALQRYAPQTKWTWQSRRSTDDTRAPTSQVEPSVVLERLKQGNDGGSVQYSVMLAPIGRIAVDSQPPLRFMVTQEPADRAKPGSSADTGLEETPEALFKKILRGQPVSVVSMEVAAKIVAQFIEKGSLELPCQLQLEDPLQGAWVFQAGGRWVQAPAEMDSEKLEAAGRAAIEAIHGLAQMIGMPLAKEPSLLTRRTTTVISTRIGPLNPVIVGLVLPIVPRLTWGRQPVEVRFQMVAPPEERGPEESRVLLVAVTPRDLPPLPTAPAGLEEPKVVAQWEQALRQGPVIVEVSAQGEARYGHPTAVADQFVPVPRQALTDLQRLGFGRPGTRTILLTPLASAKTLSAQEVTVVVDIRSPGAAPLELPAEIEYVDWRTLHDDADALHQRVVQQPLTVRDVVLAEASLVPTMRQWLAAEHRPTPVFISLSAKAARIFDAAEMATGTLAALADVAKSPVQRGQLLVARVERHSGTTYLETAL